MGESSAIPDEVDRLVRSGALGRARTNRNLLVFLAECATDGRSPKEIEIAHTVFRKAGDFDPTQDAIVRVSVHNLRRKLDSIYEVDPTRPRLTIPRGEYRLVLEADAARRHGRWTLPAGIAVLVGLVTVIAGIVATLDTSDPADHWRGILDAETPLLVVLGDYYIFGELDDNGRVARMVREFDVNSADDLAAGAALDAGNYLDLGITYFPRATAYALADVLAVVNASGSTYRIMPASELRADDLRESNIVYLGYLSGLGTLERFVFSASRLEVGDTYDELNGRRTGDYFRSNAGLPGHHNNTDYAMISRFRGPANNELLIIAGTRDSGLMQAAKIAARDDGLQHESFEALYRVTGLEQTSLDATRVFLSALDDDAVWQ